LSDLTCQVCTIYFHRHAADYAREHEEASPDVQGYLSNPINAYLLVKRLTTDWKEVETLMINDVGKGIIHQSTIFEQRLTSSSRLPVLELFCI
jgi:hypothetical protein